jgi:putative SOS response-associated peptidase YedK
MPLLFLAGLWEAWDRRKIGEASTLETFSIITTATNNFIESIHDRMQVILQQKDFDSWLSPETDLKTASSLLKPLTEDLLSAHKVSTLVNKPVNDTEKCIEPIENS